MKGGLPGLDWIAADWGTTNLRLWAINAEGRVLAEASSDEGMGSLDRAGYEPALVRLVEGWLPHGRMTRVIACGMVGSRQGWVEAPYRTVPCAPVGPGALVRAPVAHAGLDVRVVSGLKQAKPADVMRGEETQIAGFLSQRSDFDGVLCLPGTHSKWVRVSAGEVVSFRTFMTGELFSLLSRHSVLRHGVAPDGWDEGAFAAAVADALSHPERTSASLFTIRAEGLIGQLSPESARARLSGLLIGMELAGARPYWLGTEVAIIGASRVARAYTSALSEQGVAVTLADVGDMTRAGLAASVAEAQGAAA